MKIALVSEINTDNDIEFNLSKIELAIDSYDADMILFGEAYLCGFNALCFNYADDIYHTLSINSQPIAKIRTLASNAKKAVGFGYYENFCGAIYSSYLIIGANGEILANYRRVSTGWRIENTCADYREGDNFKSFSYMEHELGIMMCGDFWEDRLLAQIVEMDAHVDVILWPVHTDYSAEEWNTEACAYYAKRSEILEHPTLYIDNFHKDLRTARAYVFHQGKVLDKLDSNAQSALIWEL